MQFKKNKKTKQNFLFDLLEFDSGHNPKDLCLQRGYFLSQNGQLGS